MLVLAGLAEFPLGCTSRTNPTLGVFGVLPVLQGRLGAAVGQLQGLKASKQSNVRRLLSNQSIRTWRIMKLESDTWHGFVKG